MHLFQKNDPSIESQWRAIILFGRNSATYKFAFAKSILEAIEKDRNRISLTELARPFSQSIVEHLQSNDKQGSAPSSKFLDTCRNFIAGEVSEAELWAATAKLGFVNVVDAFHIVNGKSIPDPFFEKDYSKGKKDLVIKDSLLALKDSFHFDSLGNEVEARWKLVETAWNLNINPSLIEVAYDDEKSLLFLKNDSLNRTDLTSVRDALNGYQKGKCFYTYQNISIHSNDPNLCDVDHFLPRVNIMFHRQNGANIDGVWNLVLADADANRRKGAKVPDIIFLDKLHQRNEYYIESNHPLSETIINQTGKTQKQRRRFLQKQYDVATNFSIQPWKP